ncbi:hypothetical protein, partial [Gluconacetobacter tumulicola]
AFDMTAGLPSGHHVESQIRPLGYPKKFTQVEFRSKHEGIYLKVLCQRTGGKSWYFLPVGSPAIIGHVCIRHWVIASDECLDSKLRRRSDACKDMDEAGASPTFPQAQQ